MELGIETKTIRKYRPFAFPVGIAIAFGILSIVATNWFFGRISETRAKISNESIQKNVLSSKLSILQDVTIEIQDSSGRTTLALPQSNPSVFILNHLKIIAIENGVVVSNISTNSQGVGEEIETKRINIDLEATGEYSNVYSYIQELINISPIVNISSIDVEGDKSEITAEIQLTSFFSALPDKLPPITSQLDGFTDSERSTLLFLESFREPSIGGGTQAVDRVDRGKINPFE